MGWLRLAPGGQKGLLIMDDLFIAAQPSRTRAVEWPEMASKIPERSCRLAKIEHFTITPKDSSLAALRAAINGHRSAMIEPGRYARLLVDGGIMMTDTPMEKSTNQALIKRASGHVLIGGLGFGMVLWPLLAKQPPLLSILVVEESLDVIGLVKNHLPNDSRLYVEQGDIFKWKPSGLWPKFDTIYFDIWPDICITNIAEATRLRRRAKPWLAPGGWIGDWDAEVRRFDAVRPAMIQRKA